MPVNPGFSMSYDADVGAKLSAWQDWIGRRRGIKLWTEEHVLIISNGMFILISGSPSLLGDNHVNVGNEKWTLRRSEALIEKNGVIHAPIYCVIKACKEYLLSGGCVVHHAARSLTLGLCTTLWSTIGRRTIVKFICKFITYEKDHLSSLRIRGRMLPERSSSWVFNHKKCTGFFFLSFPSLPYFILALV